MRFYFGVVENRFDISEFNRIALFWYGVENFFYFVFFCGGEIFGICSRIGYISCLIKLLNGSKRHIHAHLIFPAEITLELWQGEKLRRLKCIFFCLLCGHRCLLRVQLCAGAPCFWQLLFRKFVFWHKLHGFTVGCRIWNKRIVNFGNKVFYCVVAIVYCFYDRHYNSADT